jgi:hypothetical protein
MNPNDNEVITQENDTETTENNTEEVVVEDVPEIESLEDLKKRLATAEAQKEHWRKKATEVKTQVPTSPKGLNAGDIQAITNAKIQPEDMDRVEWFASANNISLRQALEHPEMKAILSLREEQRNTAIATNVENVRRGTVKVTDDTLLNNAAINKYPTTDDQIEQLIAAKFKRR